MISNALQDRNERLVEYLQLLHSMGFEIERAMNAIALNSASAFEESLANQEVFSTRLLELAANIGSTKMQDHTTVRGLTNDGLMCEIQAASNALDALNSRYSALIKFSSHSIALMVSLFSSFQGQLQEGSGNRLKVQTWSCQV